MTQGLHLCELCERRTAENRFCWDCERDLREYQCIDVGIVQLSTEDKWWLAGLGTLAAVFWGWADLFGRFGGCSGESPDGGPSLRAERGRIGIAQHGASDAGLCGDSVL